MKLDLVTRVSISIIILFLVIALFAPFLASKFPIYISENNTKLELPKSPLLSSFTKNKEAHLANIDFRKLSKEGEIKAYFAFIPYSPYETNLYEILIKPGIGKFGHYMGTDDVGRDIAARMVYGSRNSMMVGLVAVAISAFIGLIIGAAAGYFGGWVDIVLSRFIEIVITFPRLILIMAVLTLLEPKLIYVMIVIGLTGWTGVARVIRGEFLTRKTNEYVQSARSQGASHMRIIWVHIMPNSLAPVLVMISFSIAGTVLLESALSFLGIGVRPPKASWGQILDTSKSYLDFAWWLTTFPGIAIFLTVVSYNLLGNYIRKYLSPRQREM